MRERVHKRQAPALLAALLAALVVAAPAGANADPASDYLISLPVFLPFESKVSDGVSKELTELLASAKDKGFEVRVAIIATRGDLGGVPVLYRKPQRYADFLGQELVYYYKGPVLVVMPNGYGVFQSGKPLAEDKRRLARLSPVDTTDGDTLAGAAGSAVRALAQRRGIALPAQSAEQSSSRSGDRMQIIAGVVLLGAVALAARLILARRGGRSDPV